MSKITCFFFMLPNGGEKYASRSYVLKEHDMYQGVKCKLHVFELVKISLMQLFLDYWFEGEIYSS